MTAHNGAKLTWGQLAAQLGCTRQTLSDYRKLPGAPLVRDVEVWQIFIDENDLGGNGANGAANLGLVGLREEKLKKDIRLKELQIAEKERTVVPMQDVDRLLLTIGTKMKSHLYASFGSVLPVEMAGMDPGHCRTRLLKVADELCAEMQQGFERWRTDAVS
jgi:hypothetical protein